MARNTCFRSKCTELVSQRQSDAVSSTIYILRETGPTGYLLKEEGQSKKFKVLLGDPHTCTCPTFVKDRELCSHICWVLLRKFRVSPDNPISWQLGLVEREVSELLRGLHDFQRRQREHQNNQRKKLDASLTRDEAGANGRAVLEQRPIEPDDVCAICQEELLIKKLPLTYCKFGCGNSIHIKCMKVWAEHQRKSSHGTSSEDKDSVKCPFCREDFGSFTALQKEYRTAQDKLVERTRDKFRHTGTRCHGCEMTPIVGKCYKCENCPSYHLCNPCFSKGIHRQHRFSWRQKTNQVWHPAERPSGSALPEAIVRSLMNRTLNSADYELLSQLDSVVHNQPQSPIQPDPTCPDYIVASIPTEVVAENSSLLDPDNQCMVCQFSYRRYDRVKILPGCKHKFHVECIDRWLLHSRATCPIDGNPVTDPTRNRRRRPRSSSNSTTQRQAPAPPPPAEGRRWTQNDSLVDEGDFILFGNRINPRAQQPKKLPRDLSPERSPFSPITSVHLQNAFHLRDLPQDDPVAQMLRQMPENLAVSSREVLSQHGKPPTGHQPALFQFPLPNQRRKTPSETTQESPRLPPLHAEEVQTGAIGGIEAATPTTSKGPKSVVKLHIQPQASIPAKNRRRSANGLVPIVSRLRSSEGDANQSGSSTSSASSKGNESGVGPSASTTTLNTADRRRAASHDAAGARRKTTHPIRNEGMRKKAQSMTAVNNGGRDANSGGVVRRDPRKESGAGTLMTHGRVAEQRRLRNEANERREDQNSQQQQQQGPFSISLRDMVGGLNGSGQMGSFSRGLLSSSPNSAGLDGVAGTMHSREMDKTIYHGRRVGQPKRLAQPGRLVAMNAGENGRRTDIGSRSSQNAMEFNVVAVTSPMSTLSEGTLTRQLN